MLIWEHINCCSEQHIPKVGTNWGLKCILGHHETQTPQGTKLLKYKMLKDRVPSGATVRTSALHVIVLSLNPGLGPFAACSPLSPPHFQSIYLLFSKSHYCQDKNVTQQTDQHPLTKRRRKPHAESPWTALEPTTVSARQHCRQLYNPTWRTKLEIVKEMSDYCFSVGLSVDRIWKKCSNRPSTMSKSV